MMLEDVKTILTDKFGVDVIAGEETGSLQPSLMIDPERIVLVLKELRDNPDTYFDFLGCLSGVDYGVEAGRFGVVYNLASIPFQTQLTLKVIKEHTDRNVDNLPTFLSVCEIYKTADWHEREAYDLIGIYFEGHQDLRRILLPDDWEGFPMRRDYKNTEYYKGIKID